MLSDILDGFGLPFSTNLLFITKTIKPQCVRSSAYKWMWRQKYSDLLVMIKVFMVLRKKKRRVDAETLSAGNHARGFSICTPPVGLGMQKSLHLYTV